MSADYNVIDVTNSLRWAHYLLFISRLMPAIMSDMKKITKAGNFFQINWVASIDTFFKLTVTIKIIQKIASLFCQHSVTSAWHVDYRTLPAGIYITKFSRQ